MVKALKDKICEEWMKFLAFFSLRKRKLGGGIMQGIKEGGAYLCPMVTETQGTGKSCVVGPPGWVLAEDSLVQASPSKSWARVEKSFVWRILMAKSWARVAKSFV